MFTQQLHGVYLKKQILMRKIFQKYKEQSKLIANASSLLARKKQRKIAAKIIEVFTKKELTLDEETLLYRIEEIHKIVANLITMTNRGVEQIPRKTLHAIIENLADVEEISAVQFISIVGLTAKSNEKLPEYFAYDEVNAMLNTGRYTVVLSPFSERNRCKITGKGNRENIQPHTTTPVVYPSYFFDKEIETVLSEHEAELINDATQRLIKHSGIRNDFSVTEKTIIDDVRDYALFGKLIEESLKPIIVIDLQKRIFPYQQPCYNILRKTPLPLVPMQQFMQKFR